ncbi:hypothetical protein BJ878DRAFT_582166 [Calycina marina]|uniref:DUF1776-domain-containing protein n=1 Tax=Calycina marina TaxID=1763456 RepID=A0A9P7Z583_9HELO|nr:hypothetical protein BJ878DRAFT_582166 [Calycina marina]
MSADDATFLDTLSSVPNDIKKYSSNVADYIDFQLHKASNTLRDALSACLPKSAQPTPPPPPPRSFMQFTTPASTLARCQKWVSGHKILTGIFVVSIGGLTYYVVKQRATGRKKRRAKKASNGGRMEVVVIAGSPSEPLVRSISLDLERRGFIVYVICNNFEEETAVHNESRADIKPLAIDVSDPERATEAIEHFTELLKSPHSPFPGAKSHFLILRSLIVIPTLTYPTSPIAMINPSTINDLISTRLLTPILTTQALLPILTSSPLRHPHHHVNPHIPKPSVLYLTPSVIQSMNPAFHAPESVMVSGLSSFTSVLRSELSPLNIPVSHLQLGTFDLSSAHPRQQLNTQQSQRAETLKWDDTSRQTYGRNYVALSTGLGNTGKGTSLRVLNNAVFDAMVSGSASTIRVGMGASIYGFVGGWVPSSLVDWMMGQRGVEMSVAERQSFD